jgi:hypothetical protein
VIFSTAAFVFKTVADPFAGRITVFRVLSGEVKPDSTLVNSRTQGKERLGLALQASSLGTWDWNIEDGRVIWSENADALMGMSGRDPVVLRRLVLHDGSAPRLVREIFIQDRLNLGQRIAGNRLVHRRGFGAGWVQGINALGLGMGTGLTGWDFAWATTHRTSPPIPRNSTSFR